MILNVSIFSFEIELCILSFLRGTGTLPRKIACRHKARTVVSPWRHAILQSIKAILEFLMSHKSLCEILSSLQLELLKQRHYSGYKNNDKRIPQTLSLLKVGLNHLYEIVAFYCSQL
jgi:hypothetical protein